MESLGLFIFIILYFLPAGVAMARHKRNAGAIVVVNLLLGWSVIGWLWALIWSITVDTPLPH